MNSLAGGHGSQIAWLFGTTGVLSIIQSMTIMDLKESCIELRFKAINLFEVSIVLSSGKLWDPVDLSPFISACEALSF